MIYYDLRRGGKPTAEKIRTLGAIYFKEYPIGVQEDLAGRLEQAGYDMIDLEYFAHRLKAQLSLIQDWIGQRTDRDNLLCYAVEIYSQMEWDHYSLDPERKQLIKTIRALEGILPNSPEKSTDMRANSAASKQPDTSPYLDDLDLQVLEEDMEREFEQLMKRLGQMEKNIKPNKPVAVKNNAADVIN